MIPGIIAQASSGSSSVIETGIELLLGFNGANGATTIRDEGPRSRPVAFSGNAALTTAQAKFGASSCTFDGSEDGVAIAPGPNLLFESGPFTVDLWVRPTASSTIRHIIGERYNGANCCWAISILNNRTIEVLITSDGSTGFSVVSSTILTTNTWYHIAVDRDELNIVRLYINGVMEDSEEMNLAIFTRHHGVTIGRQFDRGAGFQGQIDEVRILKGEAAYASDAGFAVPTTPYSRPTQDLRPDDDPYFANVVFLFGADGTPGTTEFLEDSNSHKKINYFEGVGNNVSTTQLGVFEEGAMFCNGSDITYPDSNDWYFGTSPFTIEAWVLTTGFPTAVVVAQRAGGNNYTWSMALVGSGLELIAGPGNAAGFNRKTSTTTNLRVEGVWQFVAIDKDADGTYRLYINGVCQASLVGSPIQNLGNIAYALGVNNTSDGGANFAGHLDEIRVTKGVARYATDGVFNVPEKRFSRDEDEPGWSVDPSISTAHGFSAPGDLVTLDQGTHNLRKLRRQWLRNGSAIVGQTGFTYRLTNDDLATVISCQVTGRNYNGTVSAITNTVGPVVAASYDTGALLPGGDMQSGGDRLIPSGDMQSGGDVLLNRDRLT